MSTKILGAHKFTKVLYDGPRRPSGIRLRVEASAPVSVYGITSDSLDTFRKGRLTNLFSYEDKRELDKKVPLSIGSDDDWYLIIENKSSSDVAIHYKVYDL